MNKKVSTFFSGINFLFVKIKMKQGYALAFLLSLAFIPNVFAVEVFSGALNEDLFFSDGVRLSGVEHPDDSVEKGVSSVKVEGYGSMTVGSRKSGDFPRIALVGGTRISNARDWSGYARREWWDGTLQAPLARMNLEFKKIPELTKVLESGMRLQMLGTFGMGSDNEMFRYSLPARIALPVIASNGQKVFVALQQEDGNWKVSRDKVCTVQDQLCVLDLDSAKGVALFRRIKEVATAGDLDSGDGFYVEPEDAPDLEDDNISIPITTAPSTNTNTGSPAPSSSNTNNTNTNTTPTTSSAPQSTLSSISNEVREFFEALGDDDFEAPVQPANSISANPVSRTAPKASVGATPREDGQRYDDFYHSAMEAKDIPKEEQRAYALKYLESNSDDRATLLSEEGLSGDELQKVRELNIGKLSRRLRKDPAP